MGDFGNQEHMHFHSHGMNHGHGHIHENQKAVVNRLARAIGHLEKVKRMVEEGCDCTEVLVQLAAVRSALDNTGKVILKDHMRLLTATSFSSARSRWRSRWRVFRRR